MSIALRPHRARAPPGGAGSGSGGAGTTRQRRCQALFAKTGVTVDNVLIPDSGGTSVSKFRSSCEVLGAVMEGRGTLGA